MWLTTALGVLLKSLPEVMAQEEVAVGLEAAKQALCRPASELSEVTCFKEHVSLKIILESQ